MLVVREQAHPPMVNRVDGGTQSIQRAAGAAIGGVERSQPQTNLLVRAN